MRDTLESERTAGYWLGYHDGEKSGRSECAAEIEQLRARLEIDPSHPYDGIYARDETIRQQDKQIERLRAALNERCPVDAMDQEGMTPAQAAIWHVWGERCSDFEPECITCRAWAELSQIKRLRAENEKLRAALEMFACDCEGNAICLGNCMHRNARAALEGRT